MADEQSLANDLVASIAEFRVFAASRELSRAARITYGDVADQLQLVLQMHENRANTRHQPNGGAGACKRGHDGWVADCVECAALTPDKSLSAGAEDARDAGEDKEGAVVNDWFTTAQWMPIETAPRDGSIVLLASIGEGHVMVREARWDEYRNNWSWPWYCGLSPSWWASLPQHWTAMSDQNKGKV